MSKYEHVGRGCFTIMWFYIYPMTKKHKTQGHKNMTELGCAAHSGTVCYLVMFGLCIKVLLSLFCSIICGLTQFTNRNHLAFAALEAVCFQTREVSLLFSSLKRRDTQECNRAITKHWSHRCNVSLWYIQVCLLNTISEHGSFSARLNFRCNKS